MSDRRIFGSKWSWFVIVIDDIIKSSIITTVHRTVSPVVNHIIYKVENTIPTDRWITSGIICPKVTHKRTVLTTQRTTESMIIRIQCLSRDGVLNSHIHSRKFFVFHTRSRIEHMTIERNVLIKSPHAGTVVDHNISNRITSERIIASFHFCFTATETHVTYNHIMRIHPKRFTSYTYSVSGSCLPGNSYVRSFNNNRRFQMNNTCNIKYNNTCAYCSFASFTQSTRTTVSKACNSYYFSATTTKRISATAFGTRKCRNLSLWQIGRTSCPWNIWTTFNCFCFQKSFIGKHYTINVSGFLVYHFIGSNL